MISYLKKSLNRKIARRFTKTYPSQVDRIHLEKEGIIEFAKWQNPLAIPVDLNQGIVDFFRKFIKPGDLVIDIGANTGGITVPMALAAGKEGLTLAFDPNPRVFQVLKDNSELNEHKTNIVPHNYAVSRDEDEYFYVSSEASFANGGISKKKGGKHGKYVHPEKIRGVHLHNFLKKKYPDWLEKLSFIKVDTEGYDKEILKSIFSLIRKYKPEIIAESFGKSTPEGKMELYEVLDGMDYHVYNVNDFVDNCSMTRIENASEMTQWKTTINLYATPRS